MNVDERILELRRHMEEKDIDIYVVPTSDFHQSEYVGEYFKARKFITGLRVLPVLRLSPGVRRGFGRMGGTLSRQPGNLRTAMWN